MPAPPTSGRITALKVQAHTPERINVFLDGVFAFGLGTNLALDEGLAIGEELSAERVTALKAADDIGKATEAAMRLLARRPRSTHEIETRLKQKGYAPETIAAALVKLERWRYVDDTAFAQYWIDNRETHKPRGRRLLAQELRLKGVEREIIAETLDEAEIDELAGALSLGRTKLRTYKGLEPQVARRRLAAFLGRRGYGFDVIRPVLEQLLGEDEQADFDT